MERLTEWRNGKAILIANSIDYISVAMERLASIEDILGDTYDLSRIKELVEADREGRCVVLPCKIGEKLYRVHGKNVLPVSALWFETNAKGWCVCGNYPPMATLCFAFDDFGKTVFLTREEAEKALE